MGEKRPLSVLVANNRVRLEDEVGEAVGEDEGGGGLEQFTGWRGCE